MGSIIQQLRAFSQLCGWGLRGASKDQDPSSDKAMFPDRCLVAGRAPAKGAWAAGVLALDERGAILLLVHVEQACS